MTEHDAGSHGVSDRSAGASAQGGNTDSADGARIDAARALIAEAAAFDGSSAVSDQAMLAAAQGHRELFTFAGTARTAATAGISDTADTSDVSEVTATPDAIGILGQGEIDLVVRPAARGHGLGTAALDTILARDQGLLRAWAHGENPAAEALLRRAGFAPIRTLYRMSLDPKLLPGSGADPLALPTPEGFALRTFDPASGDDAGQDDAGQWVRANAAAFASHPEQGRITEADFALMREEAWFDPADLLLLSSPEAGELAGSTWVKTVRAGDADGAGDSSVETELYAVGVRPEYAGRGLGRLLLDATLARMAQHRPSRVTLYVDGDNTNAVALYERAGFEVEQRSTQWERTTGK